MESFSIEEIFEKCKEQGAFTSELSELLIQDRIKIAIDAQYFINIFEVVPTLDEELIK